MSQRHVLLLCAAMVVVLAMWGTGMTVTWPHDSRPERTALPREGNAVKQANLNALSRQVGGEAQQAEVMVVGSGEAKEPEHVLHPPDGTESAGSEGATSVPTYTVRIQVFNSRETNEPLEHVLVELESVSELHIVDEYDRNAMGGSVETVMKQLHVDSTDAHGLVEFVLSEDELSFLGNERTMTLSADLIYTLYHKEEGVAPLVDWKGIESIEDQFSTIYSGAVSFSKPNPIYWQASPPATDAQAELLRHIGVSPRVEHIVLHTDELLVGSDVTDELLSAFYSNEDYDGYNWLVGELHERGMYLHLSHVNEHGGAVE